MVAFGDFIPVDHATPYDRNSKRQHQHINNNSVSDQRQSRYNEFDFLCAAILSIFGITDSCIKIGPDLKCSKFHKRKRKTYCVWAWYLKKTCNVLNLTQTHRKAQKTEWCSFCLFHLFISMASAMEIPGFLGLFFWLTIYSVHRLKLHCRQSRFLSPTSFPCILGDSGPIDCRGCPNPLCRRFQCSRRFFLWP